MDIDLELLEKEVFKEVVLEGDFETIAIWSDGDWSIMASLHYKEKVEEGFSPIYYLRKAELTSTLMTTDHLEELILSIESELNQTSMPIQDYSN
ncbi:hypothetical protein PU629_01305 [Pullulanibacillus sp. KACC 23026]|uniref:hypothetical protein n=1 Tax=Pullulanibacillus sp. KACC 23026 TaxID=3028315 RepID=UPI0023B11D05|nr:hypothetical protein [Pullulanibacillus sp. KACC 23026]WEG13024.1 hypothetical protein PU629_01305 [Pullulanibacillus sp. KACC 23026]